MELFHLQTKNTSYAFTVLPTGQLEHLYYGKKIRLEDPTVLSEKAVFPSGNCVVYDRDVPHISLEHRMLEHSTAGKGDIRQSLIEIEFPDTTYVSDFVFFKAERKKGKEALVGLPSSYGSDDEIDSVVVTLKEKHHNIYLQLNYSAFYESDVIVRSCNLINESDMVITIESLFSMQLDGDDIDWQIMTFDGHWGRERTPHLRDIGYGRSVVESRAGCSSNRQNPFFILKKAHTDEDLGECLGVNLVYSGNHQSNIEVSAYDRLRIVSGIHPTHFRWPLKQNESFQTPEAIFSFSSSGLNRLSQQFHTFINQNIIRKEWKYKERPVVLNNWEATYFNFNEGKILKLAKEAASIGVECFVLDDGWFKNRKDDFRALGDWYTDTKKLPHGLKWLSKQIQAMSMSFGLWVEPEMINEDSDLYRSHPDWAVGKVDQVASLSRNQRLLDMSNPHVQDYLIERLSEIFTEAEVSFVKWDYNRIFSDHYGSTLDHQGKFTHAFIVGTYRVLDELTRRFPHVLFESCASGGNRFDLGMLCYTPQIWTSDNTDALDRTVIQTGTSYGYPLSTISAHVSAVPNHQTRRLSPLQSRLAVASFGVFGCEINLNDCDAKQKNEIAAHITLYKAYRQTLQFGSFYRIPCDKNQVRWMCVDDEKQSAVGMYFQARNPVNVKSERFITRGLSEKELYSVKSVPFNMSIIDFGDLINYVSPVHIKPNSLLHKTVDIFMKVKSEHENLEAYGDCLNFAGWALKQPFVAGLHEEARIMFDQSARLYLFQQKE
jgi:alpha-galactosidase